MKERAKQPYEGLEAYEAGYMHGYDAGHADATEISNWYWDDDGTDYNIGAWRCKACRYRNTALPVDANINPYMWSGSRHCANCGRRMIDVGDEK